MTADRRPQLQRKANPGSLQSAGVAVDTQSLPTVIAPLASGPLSLRELALQIALDQIRFSRNGKGHEYCEPTDMDYLANIT